MTTMLTMKSEPMDADTAHSTGWVLTLKVTAETGSPSVTKNAAHTAPVCQRWWTVIAAPRARTESQDKLWQWQRGPVEEERLLQRCVLADGLLVSRDGACCCAIRQWVYVIVHCADDADNTPGDRASATGHCRRAVGCHTGNNRTSTKLQVHHQQQSDGATPHAGKSTV